MEAEQRIKRLVPGHQGIGVRGDAGKGEIAVPVTGHGHEALTGRRIIQADPALVHRRAFKKSLIDRRPAKVIEHVLAADTAAARTAASPGEFGGFHETDKGVVKAGTEPFDEEGRLVGLDPGIDTRRTFDGRGLHPVCAVARQYRPDPVFAGIKILDKRNAIRPGQNDAIPHGRDTAAVAAAVVCPEGVAASIQEHLPANIEHQDGCSGNHFLAGIVDVVDRIMILEYQDRNLRHGDIVLTDFDGHGAIVGVDHGPAVAVARSWQDGDEIFLCGIRNCDHRAAAGRRPACRHRRVTVVDRQADTVRHPHARWRLGSVVLLQKPAETDRQGSADVIFRAPLDVEGERMELRLCR